MAKYTTQLRSYVETGGKVFDFTYPIFDDTYRAVLEQKFIDHFYFREIGLETIGQFKHYLKDKLNRIMPYYNQLYTANEVFATYDPYKNKDVTIDETRTNVQDSTGSSTTNATDNTTSNVKSNTTSNVTGNDTTTTSATDKHSDTPQAMNQGKDYLTDMTKKDGTSTTDNTSDTTQDTNQDTTQDTTQTATGSSTGKVTTTDTYMQHIHGHDGMKYPTDILMQLRDTFINIDQMILDECYDLFMNIY